MNYGDYSTAVGEAWGDVKVFAESPEGKKLPEFSFLLVSAMGKYKLALNVWHEKLQEHLQFGMHQLSSALLRQCWAAANRHIGTAESLISGESTVAELLRAIRQQKTDANYEATVRSVLADMIALSREIDDSYLAGASGERPKHEAEHANKAKELCRKMDEIEKEDKQSP